MNKIIKYLLTLILTFAIFTNVNALEFNIKSENAILYNGDKVLYQKQAEEKVPIASLTKIMTSIVVLEKVSNLNEKIILKSEDFKGLAEENLVVAGFKAGQSVTYLDLLYGLLLPSGADAAQALTRLVAGNEDNFVKLMNAKAKELRLENTHFANAIGLDDEDNYSTATDVATMFKYALENNKFKEIITSQKHTVSDGTLTVKSSVKNNKKVGNYLLGGKTGTTDGAGLCLASIANDDGVTLLLVTTGAPYDKKGPHNFDDAKTIYDYFINNYSEQVILNSKDSVLTLSTKYTKNDKVVLYPDKVVKAYVPNEFDKNKITYKYDGIEVVTADMQKGTDLGKLKVYYDNELITILDITLKEQQQFSLLRFLMEYKIVVVSVLLVIFFFIFVKVKRKKKVKSKRRKNSKSR